MKSHALGLRLTLVPKLKYKHINISSFSKMRIALPAQANKNLYIHNYVGTE